MTILIFTGTVLLITIISNQPNQHHHYKINDQQHQQHCNLNLCRHSALHHHAIPTSLPSPNTKHHQHLYLHQHDISHLSMIMIFTGTVPFITMPGPMQKQKAKSSEAITKGFFLAKITIVQSFLVNYKRLSSTNC